MKTILLFGSLALAAGVACSSPAPHDISDAAADVATTCVHPSLTCQDPNNPPSFASDVDPIIKERCSPCHFPGGIASQIYVFTTYSDVVNAETAIVNELYDCLMPPVNGNVTYGIAPGSVPGLTAEQASCIVDWIRCGTPDN
jgi:hypothetical protein